ncbi:transporter protein [Arthrobacter sp. Hiyo8]|nr:transporter protein [Arthrobacter sp. Hiyo8]
MTQKPKLLRHRRLEVSDVNVVNQTMLKKALGGTIVVNTMEWYDVGVFGYLITTMGPSSSRKLTDPSKPCSCSAPSPQHSSPARWAVSSSVGSATRLAARRCWRRR